MTRTIVSVLFLLLGVTCGWSQEDSSAQLALGTAPYLHRDFSAAFVIHPSRIASSKLAEVVSLNALMRAGFKEAGFRSQPSAALPDIQKVRRITILVEAFPGGNVMFMPAAIVEFNEDVDAEAMLRALWPTGHFSSDENRIFQTSSFLANTRIDAVVASPRIVLIAPEDTMKKMLAKSDTSRNLLLKQMESVTNLADFHVEYVGSPTLANLSRLTGQALSQQMLKELRDEAEMDEWTKAILLDIKSLSVACDLKGPKLLQAVVDCRGVNDASRLKNLLDGSLRDLANYANDGNLPEDTPKGIAETGIPLMLDAALQTKITRTSDRLDLELLMPRSFQPLVNRLALELAQEAGVEARLPFQSFAGTWKINYSNDANRTYNIAPDGAVKYGEDTFQLERTKEGVLLTHPSKTKELLRMDGETLRVRRYHYPSLQNGSSRFPGKPTVTGTGKRL